MSGEIRSEALIGDLAVILAGALREDARIHPGSRLAAHRVRDVLGIEDGAFPSDIRRALSAVLAAEETAL